MLGVSDCEVEADWLRREKARNHETRRWEEDIGGALGGVFQEVGGLAFNAHDPAPFREKVEGGTKAMMANAQTTTGATCEGVKAVDVHVGVTEGAVSRLGKESLTGPVTEEGRKFSRVQRLPK